MCAKAVKLSDSGNDVPALLHEMGQRARAAYNVLAEARNDQKDMALVDAAMLMREHIADIMEANGRDMEYATKEGATKAELDRLMLNARRIEAMAAGLETVATLPDPVNRIIEEWERPNGLVIQRVSVPLGVIGVIYEARPNVTADAAALCIKSGNAVILRCGSECLHSSEAIAACIRTALSDAGLPEDSVQLVPTRDRAAVGEMLGMQGAIDVIVPRGGRALTERVMKESRVPTLLHLIGNCHTYIHESADFGMAREILLNAKMRRVGVCGATESLLIDAAVAPRLLPELAHALTAAGCELRGDEAARRIEKTIQPAGEADWSTEYLDAILSVKTVKNIDDAIAHINKYGSSHTDAIVASDTQAAHKFLREVSSAIVMHNTSTQFADGAEFGFGAEIGIATGKLHARGPVGAEQLTTYKYVVHGTGQVRE